MAQKEVASKISKMSFEEALGELEEIVRRIESGEVDLDSAIQAYERGAALKKHCDTKLREAEEIVSMSSGDSKLPQGPQPQDERRHGV